MKFFNTAGPVNLAEHYKLDPLRRWDLDEILTLIKQKKYFILHAPRQTGKTSCLLALRDYLNARDQYHCVYANFEAAQMARHNIKVGVGSILSELQLQINATVPHLTIPFTINDVLAETEAVNAINVYLNKICNLLDRPLILLIDEIDSLMGDTLVSVLRQLRSGYTNRPQNFPKSVILCGVRDIKDYRIHRSDDEIITGGSCFNIKAKSLTLGNFSEADVRQLYNEHTQETGQQFTADCFSLLMNYTGGQPWLVNALAYEVTFEMKENRDPTVVITPEMLEIAKERLILSRATHLDQLADKLKEPRVRRIIEPLLLGERSVAQEDDVSYCLDLGLITRTQRGILIANEIYREVLPREIIKKQQDDFLSIFTPEWVNPDQSLNSEKLFTMFQQFWRENSEIWHDEMAGYHEVAPYLTFQAFLQRVANGKGFIAREFAYGTRRADLMLKWRYPDGEQRIVIELKMLTERDSYEKMKPLALEQTANYADKCKATESHIVIFDRSSKTNWKEKVFVDSGEVNGYPIKIWGM